MKTHFCLTLCYILFSGFGTLSGQSLEVTSPNKDISVIVDNEDGKIYYSITYQKSILLEKSPLGLVTNKADFSIGLKLLSKKESTSFQRYSNEKIKRKDIAYRSNDLYCTFQNSKEENFTVLFKVSDNNVAFRYLIPDVQGPSLIVEDEITGYNFPDGSTAFTSPQALPMTGWMGTKPSYEEEYNIDQQHGIKSKYGQGYTFPALFRISSEGWVMLSETGVDANYCASRLSEGTSDGNYKIMFPQKGENNGVADTKPLVTLPAATPWRTLTIGKDLKPIVETTITYDVVEEKYPASTDYKFGRATWSWVEWGDSSVNFIDQKKYIDLASELDFQYTLIDGFWDVQIGRDSIALLSKYAAGKGIGLWLWYNSNGAWNYAPQTPKNKMSDIIERRKEMAWLKKIGIKGIKVDFFGGDKQQTMRLYEEILSDANDYGLMVIFHGCTLPRGWEKMYPNFISSEAVLASENLIFGQGANDREAFSATLHPFIRNAVASMEFGPVLLNKRHNRANNGGMHRRTTETFQIATAIVFQSAVQNFGITPNNLTDASKHIIDFMKTVPTTWDETILLDGYPGKYVVLARRNGATWYIAAINGEKENKIIDIDLSLLKGKNFQLYEDSISGISSTSKVNVPNSKTIKVTIPVNGAAIVVSK
ncbi:glycoside hydrolase family 97 catalytic domain-containing protein [Sphingobacterium oryzagri]|uniref:Glycoside hydrolase family 97 catalytic domain-containing protein n=1 Tax=Sphingobacterium oryzagri TaxID=3025669 RepID=A0ABY7WEV9_9SPHI|nr:glycoside hydrolase family 97 protein [Sphingobacterium sp. KACC 22765]WDF67061.1 glycoside hydrolase family 97 catalytic domain-containing protein [Sphingobacterium sp. KACC 22765]